MNKKAITRGFQTLARSCGCREAWVPTQHLQDCPDVRNSRDQKADVALKEDLVAYTCQLWSMSQMLYNLPKQCHQLWVKCTKHESVRDTSHSSYSILLLVPIGSWLFNNKKSV